VQLVVDARVKAVRDAETRRRAGPGGSRDDAPVVVRWMRAVKENNIIPPLEYGFDKVRLKDKVFKTRNRCRMIQYVAPQACALPGCGLPLTALHARGGCQSEQQSGLITDAANALVHCVGKYVAKGHYGRWKLLINAGVKFGSKQHDDTCPNWLLPPQGSPLPGARRDYSDKPDMMLIIGLEPGAPVPTVSTPGIRLVAWEHSCAHDLYGLDDRRREKRMKYHPLLSQLRVSGWKVVADDQANPDDWYTPEWLIEMGEIRVPDPPIFTFISGHMGSFCREDLRGFDALGIRAEDMPALLRELHEITAEHLHICMSTYARSVRQESRAPAAAPQPRGMVPSAAAAALPFNNVGPMASTSVAAVAPAHAAGIG
jgi:hypothetical protein